MKHHDGRSRSAPQDIDFIVIGIVGADKRSMSSERFMLVQMRKSGGPMFVLGQMNMIKRCLEESPDEREHTESNAAYSHSL
jgi:hypothetical protein